MKESNLIRKVCNSNMHNVNISRAESTIFFLSDLKKIKDKKHGVWVVYILWSSPNMQLIGQEMKKEGNFLKNKEENWINTYVHMHIVYIMALNDGC